jgi:phosphoserine phosphatase
MVCRNVTISNSASAICVSSTWRQRVACSVIMRSLRKILAVAGSSLVNGAVGVPGWAMKLLVFDVEGTLFRTDIRLPGTSIDSTIWQSIARLLGPDATREEIETHRKWERGEYRNYIEWMEETISIHRRYGLTEVQFRSVVQAAEYNPGVAGVLPRIDRNKYEIVLVSGGFRELAERAQRDFFIKHAFAACEYFFGNDGSLCSYNLLPCDFAGKLDFIQLMLREYGLRCDAWVFVGDGRNDVPIATSAPRSIGYRAHVELQRVCTRNVKDFEELLPMLEAI